MVANRLKDYGWLVYLHPASRGAMDIEAFKGSRKWYIQVKRKDKFTSILGYYKGKPVYMIDKLPISNKELGRLKRVATIHGATPVIAIVYHDKIFFLSARTLKFLSIS